MVRLIQIYAVTNTCCLVDRCTLKKSTWEIQIGRIPYFPVFFNFDWQRRVSMYMICNLLYNVVHIPFLTSKYGHITCLPYVPQHMEWNRPKRRMLHVNADLVPNKCGGRIQARRTGDLELFTDDTEYCILDYAFGK